VIKPSLTSSGLFGGVSPLAANAISLSSLSCAATVGTYRFASAGHVDFGIAAAIAAPSLVCQILNKTRNQFVLNCGTFFILHTYVA